MVDYCACVGHVWKPVGSGRCDAIVCTRCGKKGRVVAGLRLKGERGREENRTETGRLWMESERPERMGRRRGKPARFELVVEPF
jgi:hypothetical protein